VDRPGAHEIDDAVIASITALCERGDDALEAGQHQEAVALYRDGLALAPRPVHSWAVTTWIQGSIAEAHYLAGEYVEARDAIDDAFLCEGALGNAFLHLRLGQIELALGNRGRALDELIRAFTRAGEEVFAEEDPKYLALVKEALEA
jgi:tetratricopeptide (TPR) repeat protein